MKCSICKTELMKIGNYERCPNKNCGKSEDLIETLINAGFSNDKKAKKKRKKMGIIDVTNKYN